MASETSQGSPGPATRKKKLQSVRLDPYKRLLHRFYEPLIVLEALGKTRAEIDRPEEKLTNQSRRRRIQDNLSYLCDTEKGGKTTSAAAFQQDGNVIFLWIATNVVDTAAKRNVDFLRTVLADARQILRLNGKERAVREDNFINESIKHSKRRIGKETAEITKTIKNMKEHLIEQVNVQALARWLDAFAEADTLEIPWLAWSRRHAEQLQELELQMARAAKEVELDDPTTAFGKFRHSLGRLASHIRAPKQILDDLQFLPHLSNVQAVRLVDPGIPPEPPELDGQTNLKGILTRMLPAQDSRLQEYHDACMHLDQKYNVLDRIEHSYKHGLHPRVHAEIQVLEYFHHRKMLFVDDDPYIGCSKPSCFCCLLYIKHHPGKWVIPKSHHKIWLQWGLPGLQPPGGSQPRTWTKADPEYRYQLDILNKMIPEIRRESLDHIMKRADPVKWHPDSITGITSNSGHREVEVGSQLQTIIEGVEEMAIGQEPNTTAATTKQHEDDRLSQSTPFILSSSSSGTPSVSLEATSDSDTSDDSDTDGGASLDDDDESETRDQRQKK